MDGQALRFRLFGINNQNFIMRDEETGSWWQQMTGPLAGRVLEKVRALKEYWFDWKAYNPSTGVYGAGGRLAPGSTARDELARP